MLFRGGRLDWALALWPLLAVEVEGEGVCPPLMGPADAGVEEDSGYLEFGVMAAGDSIAEAEASGLIGMSISAEAIVGSGRCKTAGSGVMDESAGCGVRINRATSL